MAPSHARDANTEYPIKDAGARTDSTVRYEWHATSQGKALKKQMRAAARAARDRQKQARKLLSRRDVRNGADIAKRVRDEWYATNLSAPADRLKTQSRKRNARSRLDRLTARAVPGYRKWQALNRRRPQADFKPFGYLLSDSAHASVNVGWGELPPVAGLDMAVLTQPFADQIVETFGSGSHVKSDNSFVRPEIGHLVNNIVFRHRSDAWTGISYNPSEFAVNRVALGGPFTMPRAGRLKITGVMRNIYNKVVYSVRDNFGMSYADLDITVFLVALIFRNGEPISLTQPLTSDGIISHGDDFTFSKSDIDDVTPHTIEATTTEEFSAGEFLQILVGSGVGIHSEMDDMESYVNAVLWWQLKQLTIAVI